ncbi:MAG: hypothetical protein OSJ59_21115, partial [Lachnospiraceae bacterium]|nr:hypothetical protein [Lachnospiraceae bacterium]
YLKFIGKFDVPIPEPTPEELAEQEELRKKREKQREYSRRSREFGGPAEYRKHLRYGRLASVSRPFCTLNFNLCEISE